MTEDFWNKYKRDNIMGNKVFQTIYKAKQISQKNRLVTIKEYHIDDYIKENIKELSDLEEELYNREVKLMKELINLKCENFVNLIENEEIRKKKKEDNYYYIVREYCFGNLDDFITMNKGKLEPRQIQIIMNQLNNAFKILKKEKNIIHRNIKPSNILFSYKENDNYILKLSGLNYYKQGNNKYPLIDNYDKDFPIPPEGFNNVNEKYDLWSIGAIIYFMYFGEYDIGKKNSEIKDNELKDLIIKCLKDSNNRISWDEYFNHQFFKKKYSNNEESNISNVDDISLEEIELIKKYYNKLNDFTDKIKTLFSEINATQKPKKNEIIHSQSEKWKTYFNEIKEICDNIKKLKDDF